MEIDNLNVSPEVVSEIIKTISDKEYGSVEIYIEAGQIVQITDRTIRKTGGLKNSANQKNYQAYNSTINKIKR